MFKSLAILSAIALAMLFPRSDAQAQVRCPAGTSSCTLQSVWVEVPRRVNTGAQRVLRNPYGNGRWSEVKDTVNDCWKCGREGIREGVDRITGSRIGGHTSRRSRRGVR
jgi:hypothetical protein